MKSIIKTSILSAICGCISISLTAQDMSRHEFSIGVRGGLSTLNYTPSVGDSKNGMGGGISLNYTYFLTKEFGLVSGIEYSLFNSKIEGVKLSSILTELSDPSDQELFDFSTEINKYEEKQTAHYLNIPLMVQYQRGESTKFYTAIGFKFGIPISGRFSSKGNFENQGFFYESGIWTDTPEFMGFGHYPDRQTKDNISFQIAYIASIEAGIKFLSNKNNAFYIGAYCDYGLNNVVNNSKQNFINYMFINDKGTFTNNSILASYTSDYDKFTEKVKPMSVGLKFRFSFYK